MKNKEFYIPVTAGLIISIAAVILMLFISKECALICALISGALMALFIVYTDKRYRAISRLNDYLSLVCAGNYDLAPEKNAEGELSILQNNLLKVISQLNTQNEVIEADRLYLADSLADISHQLKTPLTSMLVASELLEKEENEAKRKELSELINKQCGRMSWLIQTLLKLSRLDAGTAELNNAELSVGDIIDGALEPFMLTMDLKNISVKKSVNEFTFKGDRNWSVEAFQNIIKNCIEHTADGGCLTLITDETTVYKRIIIKDNGCGISKEDLPHVFERFYHGKNSSDESVGIGLALSKTILNKENASLSVTSEEGEGASFEIKFYKSVV
ncbi:MAG: HAMP domain-containing histidine kinase [Eubacterium sp.]|nr:HAMP domain-containing histidine kinase [Eubacterium sp.]